MTQVGFRLNAVSLLIQWNKPNYSTYCSALNYAIWGPAVTVRKDWKADAFNVYMFTAGLLNIIISLRYYSLVKICTKTLLGWRACSAVPHILYRGVFESRQSRKYVCFPVLYHCHIIHAETVVACLTVIKCKDKKTNREWAFWKREKWRAKQRFGLCSFILHVLFNEIQVKATEAE